VAARTVRRFTAALDPLIWIAVTPDSDRPRAAVGLSTSAYPVEALISSTLPFESNCRVWLSAPPIVARYSGLNCKSPLLVSHALDIPVTAIVVVNAVPEVEFGATSVPATVNMPV
jgi:hypothetical protein